MKLLLYFFTIMCFLGCTRKYIVMPNVKGRVYSKVDKKPINGVEFFVSKFAINNFDTIKTDEKGRFLVFGIPITINFEKAIKSIEEKHFQENENIGIFREYFWPIEYLFENRSEEIFTSVELKYKVLGKTYIKKVMFPFSKQSMISILKFQKCTILFYNEETPQQSIIDLRFIGDNV